MHLWQVRTEQPPLLGGACLWLAVTGVLWMPVWAHVHGGQLWANMLFACA